MPLRVNLGTAMESVTLSTINNYNFFMEIHSDSETYSKANKTHSLVNHFLFSNEFFLRKLHKSHKESLNSSLYEIYQLLRQL